ncbi:hypothetical protein [Pacificimonas pallii]|nr:hypothetical protein [Pacificimonas pallii]
MTPEDERETAKRRKQRNYVLGGILLAFAALFYAITVVRMQV